MISIGGNLISNLNSIANNLSTKTAAADTNGLSGFKEALAEALDRFEQVSGQNALSTLDLLTGNTDDLAGTMIASQKSELALDLTVALRNKAIDAYKEIMNMQV